MSRKRFSQLKDPARLSRLDHLVSRHVRRRRDLIAESSDRERSHTSLAVAACARLKTQPRREGPQSVVLAATREDVESITAIVQSRFGVPREQVVTLRPESDGRKEESNLKRGAVVLVATPERLIDHIRRDNVTLAGVHTVGILVPESRLVEQFSADAHFIYAKLGRRPATIALLRTLSQDFDLLEDLLVRPRTVDSQFTSDETDARTPRVNREENTMSDLPFDPKEIKERVSEIVRAIHEDEDPVELTQYRKWVRKNTSIFNRGYILAYLLKYSAGGERPPRGKRSSAKSAKGRRGAKNDREDRGEERSKERAEVTSDGKQSIFVSIGRSKRVRSRDLITFFTSADGVTNDDIGQVKVLDNYSFVEVAEEKAQGVIDALNGQEFRGRKLTVNYARRK